eukprot:gene3463-3959_t
MDETEIEPANSNGIPTASSDSNNIGLSCEKGQGIPANKVHTIDFKFFISQLAQTYNYEHIAKAFDIGYKDVDEWKTRGDLLKQAYHEKYGINYNPAKADESEIFFISTLKPVSTKQPEDVTSSDIKRKCSYNAEFKLKAVEYAEMTTNRAAAKQFNVHDKRIREWRKNKEILLSSPKDRKRLRGAGRKPLVKDSLEPILYEWVLMVLKDGKQITINELQERATEMSITALPPGNKFTAYKPWVERFLKRHNLITVENIVQFNIDNESIEQFVPPTMVIDALTDQVNEDEQKDSSYLHVQQSE